MNEKMTQLNNKEDNFITQFKDELVCSIKKQAEKEIEEQVKAFEKTLREKTSAKIVSFVDDLKIIITRDFNSPTPKMIIEVHI